MLTNIALEDNIALKVLLVKIWAPKQDISKGKAIVGYSLVGMKVT